MLLFVYIYIKKNTRAKRILKTFVLNAKVVNRYSPSK